jgi:hypothetical protein
VDISEILIHAGEALGHVVLVGLLLGAGLPALFALGVLGLDGGRGAVGGEAIGPTRPGTVAGLCFGICVLAVVAGVVVVAYGKQLFGG